jgi:hypothetical protein
LTALSGVNEFNKKGCQEKNSASTEIGICFSKSSPDTSRFPDEETKAQVVAGLHELGNYAPSVCCIITQAPKFSSVDNGSRGESPDALPTNCDWKDDCLIGRIHCKGATPPVNRYNSGNAHVRL